MSHLVGLAMVHYLLTCGVGYVESRSVGAQAALGTYTQANYHNYVNNYVATQVNYHNQLFPVPELLVMHVIMHMKSVYDPCQQCLTNQRRGHWVACSDVTVVDPQRRGHWVVCDKKHEIMAATLAGMHANETEGTTSVVQHKLGCVSDSCNQLLSNNNSRQAIRNVSRVIHQAGYRI